MCSSEVLLVKRMQPMTLAAKVGISRMIYSRGLIYSDAGAVNCCVVNIPANIR
jgi:hypothetical protein